MPNRSGGGVRVLHVDDDQVFLDLTGDMIERQSDDISVESVSSAEEAVDVLEDEEFDCLVSDYDMEGYSGLDLLEEVREMEPELPFVLFTGKGSEEIASQAITAGVTDYIQKQPGAEQYEVLVNRVENAVDARRSKVELAERTRKLETLIENLPGIVYRCDNEPGWPMEYVEGECPEITGYSCDDIEDGRVSWGEDVVHPDDRDDVWIEVQDGLEEDGSFELTYRVVGSDDETTWVWESGRGIYSGGDLVALEGFITNLPDRAEFG